MKTIIESIIGRRGTQHFTANDLQDGDIIILRSGVAMLIRNGEARSKNPGGRSVTSTSLKDFINPDLTAKTYPDDDIMEVYRIESDLEPPLTDFDYFSFELLNLIDNIQHNRINGTKIRLVFERK